ncbi:hypothetical protein AKJ56_01475 [candidate division MSBL1 archaeon SCGC-AAA382N08]|uniref:Cobinamide adenolsyltransferase n=1 Tax=candidate division MSBL1 archaeon SCGC-AAA382N08 TaxID=1698285 RepID=A0A133VPN8_9EURY|nr:hypothetical protein AKJ56_01475 [candidate division MSBL1 archaeon SCGC-AAA382N08]
MCMKKGLIQIYTGRGKGKTTAAVGQAIRGLGHGVKVCFVYFFKVPSEHGYGEFKVLEDLGVKVRGFAKKHPDFFKEVSPENAREQSLKGLKFVEKIFEDSFDMVVLDELIVALRDEFLKEEEVLELLEKKPEETEVILTGRGATSTLMDNADLVSKIEKVKHPYDEGIESREGVEF